MTLWITTPSKRGMLLDSLFVGIAWAHIQCDDRPLVDVLREQFLQIMGDRIVTASRQDETRRRPLGVPLAVHRQPNRALFCQPEIVIKTVEQIVDNVFSWANHYALPLPIKLVGLEVTMMNDPVTLDETLGFAVLFNEP